MKKRVIGPEIRDLLLFERHDCYPFIRVMPSLIPVSGVLAIVD